MRDYILRPVIKNESIIVSEAGYIDNDGFSAISFRNTGSDHATINDVHTLNTTDSMLTFGNELPALDSTKYKITFAGAVGPKIEVCKTYIVKYIRIKIEEPLVRKA